MKKYKIDETKCDICGACSAVCPVNAIILSENYARINQKLCIGCKKCYIVCPIFAIEEIEGEK